MLMFLMLIQKKGLIQPRISLPIPSEQQGQQQLNDQIDPQPGVDPE